MWLIRSYSVLKLLLHSHEFDDLKSNHIPSSRKPRSPDARRGADRPVFLTHIQSASDSSTTSGSESPIAIHPLPSRVPPFATNASAATSLPPPTMIFIDVLPPWSDRPDFDPSTEIAPSSPTYISETGDNTFRPSVYPRSLWTIDPTVTFRSSSAINAYSTFNVSLNDVLIHTESTELKLLDSHPEGDDALLYSTPMVPRFWKTICQSDGKYEYAAILSFT
jgi:transcriptional enhancer factor